MDNGPSGALRGKLPGKEYPGPEVGRSRQDKLRSRGSHRDEETGPGEKKSRHDRFRNKYSSKFKTAY